MTRYEFIEGSSSKFWEFEQEGCDLHVAWGKIGTAGQSQVKSFPSEAKAQEAATKLVKEKTGKGYSLVSEGGASPVAAPPPEKPAPAPVAPSPVPPVATPPAPTPVAKVSAPAAPPTQPVPQVLPVPVPAAIPASPPTPSRFTDAIVWTPETEAMYADEWGNGIESSPFPSDDDAHLLSQIGEWYDQNPYWPQTPDYGRNYKNSINLEKGLEHADADGLAAHARLLDYVHGRLPAPFDVERDAAVAVLATSATVLMPLAAIWLRHMGPEFVFDLVCAGFHYNHDSTNGDDEGWPIWLTRFADPNDHTGKYGLDTLLGSLLATVPPEVRTALHARAVTRRPQACHALRLSLTAAFRDEAWASEDAAFLLESPMDFSVGGRIARLVRHELADLARRKFGYHSPYQDGPFNAVKRLGFDAIPFLEVLSESDRNHVEVAHALSILQCTESARILATFLDKKGYASPADQRAYGAVAQRFYANRPDLAILVLGPIAAGRGKLAVKVEPVLKAALRSNPHLLDGLRGALDTRTCVLLSGWAAPAAALQPLADPASVHPALVDPPWKKKPVTLPTIKLELTVPHVPANVEPRGHEDLDDIYVPWGVTVPEGVKVRTPAFDAIAEAAFEELRPYYRDSLLNACSDTFALRIWEERGSAYFDVSPLKVYKRHGVELWPLIVRSVRDDSAFVTANFQDVAEPRLARPMCFALDKRTLRSQALAWFARFPEAAAQGLFPLAFGPNARERDMAQRALRFLIARSRGMVVRVAHAYGAEAEMALAALEAAPAEVYPKKIPPLPSFIDPATLSQVTLAAGGALSRGQVENLLTILSLSPLDAPLLVLGEIKETLDSRSAAEFAWDLFQQWLAAGANNKEAWCLGAVGHLGNDESARRITPLIRAWPGESAHARAVVGLDVLAQIGTDVALMHLHGIAQKLKFKGLQDQARLKIDQIAEQRGLTAAELADRLVPDLDLDESGSRVLDFGPRQFRVAFDETLSPCLIDASGRKIDLPKPNKADDAEKAREATEIWKTLKKDARTIAQAQVLRLEQVMCAQRRLAADTFKIFFVEHPLMIHLVRRLVWGTYDENGLTTTFRVAEDRSMADIDDGEFRLPETATVGLVHRLEMSPEVVRRWSEVLGDYEVLQPFAQISRDTYVPTEAERTQTHISRGDFKAKTGRVLGLENRGWRKGENEQGMILSMIKPLGGGVYAELPIDEGIMLGMMDETAAEQKITGFDLKDRSGPVQAGSIPAACFSELIRDVEMMRD